MPHDNSRETAEKMARLLLDTLMLAKAPELPEDSASVESAKTLHAYLLTLREVLFAFSNGDLSADITLKGYLGGTLKSLQAHLRHMTWQTRMVADGDFSQRVEFMGEFAESFNTMVEQFDRTVKELVNKKTELSRLNEDLQKEITIRRRTEAALRKNEKALRRLAITDSLTGLFNRRHFNQLAMDAIGRALRYERPLSVVSFDIDFFKKVNDSFGHSSGDQVLKTVARVTREVLRETDIPARFGGEEFIVLLNETPAPEAAKVAERLRQELEQAVTRTEKGPIRITASFGVSDYLDRTPAAHRDTVLSEFLTNADRAMYASKNSGRNRVTIFEAEPGNRTGAI